MNSQRNSSAVIALALIVVAVIACSLGDETDFASIDHAVLDVVSRGTSHEEFDLIVGLVGLGLYALERWPAHSGVDCVERIVSRLGELAERPVGGVAWRTHPEFLPEPFRSASPLGYFDLGIAHGVPGASDTTRFSKSVANAAAFLLPTPEFFTSGVGWKIQWFDRVLMSASERDDFIKASAELYSRLRVRFASSRP